MDVRKRKDHLDVEASSPQPEFKRPRPTPGDPGPTVPPTPALNLLSQGPEAFNEEFTRRFREGHSQPGNLNPDGTPITDELTWVKTMLLHTQDRMAAAWEEIESIRAKSEEMAAKSEMVSRKTKGWKIEKKYRGSFDVLLGHIAATKTRMEELGKIGEVREVEEGEGAWADLFEA